MLPCCLGSVNINYKIVVGRRAILGKAAPHCAPAQLEYENDVGGVKDLLPFQASLTDISSGDKHNTRLAFACTSPPRSQGVIREVEMRM